MDRDYEIYEQGFKAGVEYAKDEIFDELVDIRIEYRKQFKGTMFDKTIGKLISKVYNL